jgi:predicted TPR repeat methyltransferase
MTPPEKPSCDELNSGFMPSRELKVEFPEPSGSIEQDDEWCFIHENGESRKIRFHDYHKVFSVPGLYEHLFHDRLDCKSPEVVCDLLNEEVAEHEGEYVSALNVLEIGSGNGVVGEQLRQMGVRKLVGVDIIDEAADAAQRDRPGIYDEYHVADLTELSASTRESLQSEEFNCLVTVAALGFGDLPPEAFSEAYNMVAPGGWVAFNIKEDFVDGSDSTGFSDLIQSCDEAKVFDIRRKRRYRHRYSTSGDPLHYVAFVAQKLRDISDARLAAVGVSADSP